MQAAPQHVKRVGRVAELVVASSDAAPREPVAEEVIEKTRQDYLDALPIAGAICCLSGGGDPYIDLANMPFRQLTEWNGHHGKWLAEIPFLAGTIGTQIGAFLAGEGKTLDFEATDGRLIAGRHFTMKLARLAPTSFAERRCLFTLLDRTAQVETEKSLRAEMLRDSLTGLPNRSGFNERIEAVLDDPAFGENGHAVVVIDMRRFARINECMGALAGDELLITFARRLFSALRAGDVLARTGGDEFSILMRLDKGLDDALNLADRIAKTLSTPFRLSELEIRVDCSIGIALVTGFVELSEEILRNAQFALKCAKQSGRPEVYEVKQARAARRRFSVETELRRAIERDELDLAFQPLVDLATGAVTGFEALARWDHEDRGPISPEEFVPVAEESGLIVPLGRWAVDRGLATLAQWDRTAGETLAIGLNVNLSAVEIARGDVSATVAEALTRYGIAGARLTMELTESALVHDPERAASVLQALKELDVSVAMDDFGTGYTSMAYLQRLPIDMLKIDRSFVTPMLEDKDQAAIVRAILSLAQALGMATTAEGIESAALAEALRDLGCGFGQGFHFAEPLGPDAALAYWRRSAA